MNQPTEPARPVVLFDGVCNLCSAWMTWILEHDRRGEFRFASLQSDAARAVLTAAGVQTDIPDSVVLIDGAGVHTRSDAVIRIARRLGFPGGWIAAGVVVPRPIRDALYEWVARNRHGWFGRRDACMVPPRRFRSRFLDAEPADPAPGVGTDHQPGTRV